MCFMWHIYFTLDLSPQRNKKEIYTHSNSWIAIFSWRIKEKCLKDTYLKQFLARCGAMGCSNIRNENESMRQYPTLVVISSNKLVGNRSLKTAHKIDMIFHLRHTHNTHSQHRYF